VLDDALESGFVEVARQSVLYSPAFDKRFRSELLATTRATRPLTRGERPVEKLGFTLGDLIASAQSRALKGELPVHQALKQAQQEALALVMSS
jgi:hypothetical protein